MKKLLLIMPLVFLFGCGDDSNVTADGSKTTEQSSNWEYSQETDEMDDHTNYYATATSKNTASIRIADMEEHMTITVRNRGEENDVLLAFDELIGFVSDLTASVRVRFDDEKAETYECSLPADYSPTTIFIDEADKFIANLKKAKKVKIEATLIDNGTQVLEFDVDGFKWEH
ncbi:MAG TPA: hypothetical protein PLP27_05630 [Crocinitomicaceae bacterium]|nr:hypothetical protein [Crocinitomicaceae bacterium]